MPRNVVERAFDSGLDISQGPDGAATCLEVVGRNEREGVTWVHSNVSDDGRRTFGVYDAPDPQAIRRTASDNDLPVAHITQIRVLDPYFHS